VCRGRCRYAIPKVDQGDRDKLVKASRALESDPIGKDAKKNREWATQWVIQVPDISVEICAGYLGPLLGSKYTYETELNSQEPISMTAFIIEHEDKANDRVAVHQAGVEGVLKAYESILKSKPDAKMEYLDGLIAKRGKGELKAYVEEVLTTKCRPQ